jgi:hypothetical protein
MDIGLSFVPGTGVFAETPDGVASLRRYEPDQVPRVLLSRVTCAPSDGRTLAFESMVDQ